MSEEPGELSELTFEKIRSGDTFARLAGADLLELKPGFARAELKVTENTLNFHDMAHGGVIFTLADLVCEAVANSYEIMGVAVQTNIHFLAAGKCGDLLTATAEMTGRFQAFGVIDFEINNQAGRLLSMGKQTVIFKE